MLFYNLNSPSQRVNFKEATIKGQGAGKGLFFPERIPVHPASWIGGIGHLSTAEIGMAVMEPYVGDCIPAHQLARIVEESFSFDIPLVDITPRIASLELFHGPTLAFKDVGARFMSRCLGYFMQGNQKPLTVLVATSGDTGGAVANGFFGVEGVRVVILYPSGKVSSVQEQQLTTSGKNITAIEVKGSFDDCQRLVKQAFSDKELNESLFLTSANSINVARWLPQQLYYFLAWKQWERKEQPPVISVPSGNFGNICAGLLAWHSGLPVRHFVAATNANDVVPSYLATGDYRPEKAKATLSNAMDVGDPSNFVRVLELFNKEFGPLKRMMSSFSISDDDTEKTIRTVYNSHQYLLDPHGAVGFLALEKYLTANPGERGIFLETAHPVKFYDAVERVTGKPIELPPAVSAILHKQKSAVLMEPDFELLKEFLFLSGR
jgi:threonine synthase